ncbi:hypothetical protein PQ465_07680 [Sphingobacterium oryzagri]|uniref:TonB C-terminal domain-containing protein n=1 Tax=Sphingobacterium oryzagri TaxID=3025669 RepID=A0ABY7WKY9_9SPHI|nr:hypothetical protein [Sphingobacterium sp. KACC 22765]WDF70249.1 hypothetical protein PQ465_07680 [Sphingobacterium sp. KACC 22765]
MYKYVLTLSLFLLFVSGSVYGQSQKNDSDKNNRAFAAAVQKRYKVSKAMRKARLYGQVVVGFTVDTLGQMVDFKIVEDLGFGTAEEFIRVLKLYQEAGPRWSPGIAGGKKVAVPFTMPITIDTR